MDISSVDDPVKRKALETMVKTYGQTPKKLFNNPHPSRACGDENIVRAEGAASSSKWYLSMFLYSPQTKVPFVRAREFIAVIKVFCICFITLTVVVQHMNSEHIYDFDCKLGQYALLYNVFRSNSVMEQKPTTFCVFAY